MTMETLFRSSAAQVAPEANRADSTSKYFGANGELNAVDKNDAIKALKSLASALESKQVVRPTQTAEKKAERRAALIEAMASDAKWAEMGAALSTALYTTANREGFMRRLFARQELAQGNIPRIPVKFKNTVAVVAAGAGQVIPVSLRDKYVMPPEFYIETNLWIEERELAQGTGDQLEDKFYEGQEAIQVQEDRYWKKLCDNTIGVANNLQILGGGLDPDSLALMKEQVVRYALPAANLLFAVDGLNDLNGTVFGGWFDPVTQYEVVMSGQLGTLSGMAIITDAYREPMLKVFNRGEFYITSTPEYHGGYTDRGPLQSKAKDSTGETMGPARGWMMFELMSMVMHNARSFVKGVKAA